MKEFNKVRDLALYFREIIDQYAGRPLPESVKEELVAYCKDPEYSRKIFKGQGFAKGFEVVMRDYRLEILKQVLQDEGFYE